MLEVSGNIPPAGVQNTQPVVSAKVRHFEAGKDNLSSSKNEPGCFTYLWTGVRRFFEGIYNFFRNCFCGCGSQKIFPKVFEAKVKSDKECAEIVNNFFPNWKCKGESLLQLYNMLKRIDQVLLAFEENKKLDPAVMQMAIFKIKRLEEDGITLPTSTVISAIPENKEEFLKELLRKYFSLCPVEKFEQQYKAFRFEAVYFMMSDRHTERHIFIEGAVTGTYRLDSSSRQEALEIMQLYVRDYTGEKDISKYFTSDGNLKANLS